MTSGTVWPGLRVATFYELTDILGRHTVPTTRVAPAHALLHNAAAQGLEVSLRHLPQHLRLQRQLRFISLHRLRSILCVINSLGNLLAAHGQPQSLQQTGALIQF